MSLELFKGTSGVGATVKLNFSIDESRSPKLGNVHVYH